MQRSWWALAGATVVGAIVTIAIVLQTSGGPACAAMLTAGSSSGVATYYGNAGPGGNCSFPHPPSNKFTTAASPVYYRAAAGCGTYVDITGPKGTIRAKVDNLCPECAQGHWDLSTEAFNAIGNLSAGKIPVTYRIVTDPALSAGLSFRVKEGSSQWWMGLLVDNAGNEITSVQLASGSSSSWKTLRHTDYNYWLGESSPGPGPYRVKVTDVYGRSATATNIRLSPGSVQQTSVRLYGAGSPSPATAPAATAATPTPKTTIKAASPPATKTPATAAGATSHSAAAAVQPITPSPATSPTAVASASGPPDSAGAAQSTSSGASAASPQETPLSGDSVSQGGTAIDAISASAALATTSKGCG